MHLAVKRQDVPVLLELLRHRAEVLGMVTRTKDGATGHGHMGYDWLRSIMNGDGW